MSGGEGYTASILASSYIRPVGRGVGAGCALVLIVLQGAASAQADTLGRVASSSDLAGTCGPPAADQIQTVSPSSVQVPGRPTPTPVRSYTVPANGMITAWTTNADGGTGEQFTMKIFRPVPGGHQVVGHDGPRALVPNTINRFPTNIQVQTGDLLGLNDGPVVSRCGTDAAGASIVELDGDLGDGGVGSFTPFPDFLLNVSATFEPFTTVGFGELRRNRRRGTAVLPVSVPNTGQLTAAVTSGIHPGSFSGIPVLNQFVAYPPGYLELFVQAPDHAAHRGLRRKGKARVTVSVRFTLRSSSGGITSRGSPQSTVVVLKKRLRRKR